VAVPICPCGPPSLWGHGSDPTASLGAPSKPCAALRPDSATLWPRVYLLLLCAALRFICGQFSYPFPASCYWFSVISDSDSNWERTWAAGWVVHQLWQADVGTGTCLVRSPVGGHYLSGAEKTKGTLIVTKSWRACV
jgi:hypothetical protein